MKFYFCETCGKRLTEKDVEAGQARDKKLKGIFCSQCAVGVMTMETMPISDEQARKILGKSPTPSSSAPSASVSIGKPSRDSERMRSAGPPRASEAAIRAMHASQHPASAKPNNALIGIVAGLGIAVLLGAILLFSGGDKHKPSETAKSSAQQTPTIAAKTAVPPADLGSKSTPPIITHPGTEEKTELGSVTTPAPAEPPRTPDPPAHPPAAQVTPTEPATKPPDAPAPPAHAQLSPPSPAIPPILTDDQRAVMRFCDDLFAKLSNRQADAALLAAKNSKLEDAKSLAPLLERADELQKKALESLNKKPPAAPITIKFKGTELTGQLKRVEGPFAWVVSKGLEIRVGVEELPIEIFLDALALDANTDEGKGDLEAYHFGHGRMDDALSQAKRLDATKSGGLVGLIDRYHALQRLAKFEVAVLAIEEPIKEYKSQEAVKLLDNLKKTYADLAEGTQKECVADLEKRTEGAKIVNLLARDMIGYWNFDEEQGTTTKDLSGTGNDGTVKGAKWVKGRFGGGLSFTAGSKDAVSVPFEAGKKVTNNFTMALWVLPNEKRVPSVETNAKADGILQYFTLFPYCYDTLVDAGAGISIGTNGIGVYEHAGLYLPSLLVYDKEITAWTHVAVVYADKQPKLYVNGKHVRTGIKSAKVVHVSAGLGGSNYRSFGGILDEVRIFSRALTDDEIAKLAAYNLPSK